MLRWTRDVNRRMFAVMAEELRLSAQERVPVRLRIRKAAHGADRWLLRRLERASLRRVALFCKRWAEWMCVFAVLRAVWCLLKR
jgi:hypothetical protein